MPTDSDTKIAFSDFERTGWERAASAYHRHWGELSMQSAVAMLVAARVTVGCRLLDVASGAGYVAAEAHRLGSNASGVDFSLAQVELAGALHPQLEFLQADAEELPFPDETFDAVVMGFGMNHMPDPDRVCEEILRVLKRGGRFAFTVWAAPRKGEGFGIVLSAIDILGKPVDDLPEAPPYFRFADAEEATSLLERCGFMNAKSDEVAQFWRHGTADQLFDAFNEGAVRATAMLRSQPADIRERIRSQVRLEVEALRQGDQYVVPVPAVLSYARKP